MPKMLQVRNVPDELHRRLAGRAALSRMSLSDYVLQILQREAGRPPREEVFERVRRAEPVELDRPVWEYIREARREEFGDW